MIIMVEHQAQLDTFQVDSAICWPTQSGFPNQNTEGHLLGRVGLDAHP